MYRNSERQSHLSRNMFLHMLAMSKQLNRCLYAPCIKCKCKMYTTKKTHSTGQFLKTFLCVLIVQTVGSLKNTGISIRGQTECILHSQKHSFHHEATISPAHIRILISMYQVNITQRNSVPDFPLLSSVKSNYRSSSET